MIKCTHFGGAFESPWCTRGIQYALHTLKFKWAWWLFIKGPGSVILTATARYLNLRICHEAEGEW